MKYAVIIFALAVLSLPALAGDITSLPDNTWVRLCDAPGDAIGRDVPPGRGATWTYDPNTQKFLRYGGYTPTFSNALDAFDPATNAWTRLFAHDETYPAARPGGGSSWLLAHDSARNVIWIAGGWRSAGYNPMPYNIGSQGIWKYDPVGQTFTKAGDALEFNTHYVYDPVNDVIVTSPIAGAMASKFNGRTYVFDLSTEAWEARSTSPLPQETYSGSHPAVYDPSIGRVVLLKGTDTWHYDAAANQWTQVTTTGTPTSSGMAVLAYDPANQVIVRYGGSDGKHYSTYQGVTEIYKGSTRTWTSLSCPGIPVNAQSLGNKPLFYHKALAWDPSHQCLLLCDPDLGVYAFKYNPSSAAGTVVVDAESLVVAAARNNTAAPGPAGGLRPFW